MPAGPSMPPAPGLFSTMIGWPRWREAISESLRRCVSVEPPAGQGTMSVIGRVGYVSAAPALAGRIAARASMHAASFGNLIAASPLSFGLHVGGRDHLRPLGDFLVEEPRGIARRAADGFHAQLLETRADLRRR